LQRFWEVEKKQRLLTASLTTQEEDDLYNLRPDAAERTLIRYFGDSDSEEMMACWVQRVLNESGCTFEAGDHKMVAMHNPVFSLLKGLMRSMQENQDASMFAGCHCFCKQYFCPTGCGCLHVQGRKVAKENPYWKEGMTLCSRCATCLRCGKCCGCRQLADAFGTLVVQTMSQGVVDPLAFLS